MPILGTIASSYAQATTSYFSIASYEVTSGGSSFIEFTSIPNTYKYLQIRMLARGTNSASHVTTQIQFNGNTSATYYGGEMYQAGGAVAASTDPAATSITYGPFVAAANQATSIFGVGTIDIFEYANTNINTILLHWSGYENNSASTPSQGHSMIRVGAWDNTSEVTSIKLSPNAGNWAQYSRFSLYGIKGA